MIDLPPEQLSKIRALFEKTIPNNPRIFSILEGRNPGNIYVDNAKNPRRALALLPHDDAVCIGGKFDQESLNEGVSFLSKRTEINLYWPSQGFGELKPPPSSSGEIEVMEFFDLAHEFEHLKLVSQNVPINCNIHRIDRELIKHCLWHDHIIDFCGTIDNFLSNGLGYCLMKGTEIVVEAYVPFWGAGHAEIGGITHENYRKLGYAYTTMAYLITQCVEKGFKTRWSTGKKNTASVALARKLGYKMERTFKLLEYEKT